MRFYEIVLIIDPSYGDQISKMMSDYKEIIVKNGGKVNRVENWGKRQLAYSIKKFHTAYYVLLNIEISQNILSQLNEIFRFNDVIIRSIIMRTRNAVTDPSAMIKNQEVNQEKYTITTDGI